MPFYFTTLTLVDNLPISSLDSHLQSYAKWLYVHEYGKSNDNHHIHTLYYMTEEQAKRTDKLTTMFQELYDKDFLKSLPDKSKLVRTKQAPKWQDLYKKYLLKEASNSKFTDLKYDGFETAMLQRLFKEANCENILISKVKVSMLNAPQYIYNYMKEKGIPRDYPNLIRIMEFMMSDGYIMHHLTDEHTLPKINIGLQCLLYPTKYVPKKEIEYEELFSSDIL